MKRLSLSLLAAALLFAVPAFAREQAPVEESTTATSGKPSVEKALTDWKDAVEHGKVDEIMKMYDPKAIVISTFAQEPLTKREEIKGYFKKIAVNTDIQVNIQDSYSRVFESMAVINGRYTLSYVQEGETISIPARFSFVYVLKGGKWMIITQHSSRVPLPDKDE